MNLRVCRDQLDDIDRMAAVAAQPLFKRIYRRQMPFGSRYARRNAASTASASVGRTNLAIS